jgi:hypothetical protein
VSEVHILKDLGNNLGLLTSEQRLWYQNAHSLSKPQLNLWYPEQYRVHANLIIHAEPKFAQRYCLCGANGSTCNHREFCYRCADLEWRKKFAAFEHSYHKSTWTFVTASFTGGGLDLMSPGAENNAVAHWKAIKEEFSQWLKDYAVSGAIISEEVAVLSFLPCKVLPHAHALVNGTEITETMRADLEVRISKAVQTEIGSCAMAASVYLTKVEDENAYREKFKYLYKPIGRIEECYEKAWRQVEEDLQGTVQLNSMVKDFVRWTGTGTMAKGIRCYGNMYCRDPKKFIGDAKKVSKKKQKKKRAAKKKRMLSIVEIMEQAEREAEEQAE